MPAVTLESFLWDLVSLECTFPTIKGYLDCIQARHRRAGLTSPISGALSYSRLSRGLQRFQGRQRRFAYPIHRTHIAALLREPAESLTQLRNSLAAALTTTCCMSPGEGAALQSCDVFFDFDVASGLPGYVGTAAINIMSRKNDQLRRGHHPRIGRPQYYLHDPVHQLRSSWSGVSSSLAQAAGNAPTRTRVARSAHHSFRCQRGPTVGQSSLSDTLLPAIFHPGSSSRSATSGSIRLRLLEFALAEEALRPPSRPVCLRPSRGCRVATLSRTPPGVASP